MIDFEAVIISKEKGFQNRIQEALSHYPKYHPQYTIDWSEYECSIENFMEFSIDKLSKSMAYRTAVMTKNEAANRLESLIENFDANCNYFTNWDDVDEDRLNASGWTPVTKHTFDCCLIVMDQSKIAMIVIIDED